MANLTRDEVLKKAAAGESFDRSDLRGLDLSHAALEGVDLRRADLEGTNLEGAALEIIQPPAMCHCRVCGQDFEPDSPIALCPCGSVEVTVLTGQDLKITSVQVA